MKDLACSSLGGSVRLAQGDLHVSFWSRKTSFQGSCGAGMSLWSCCRDVESLQSVMSHVLSCRGLVGIGRVRTWKHSSQSCVHTRFSLTDVISCPQSRIMQSIHIVCSHPIRSSVFDASASVIMFLWVLETFTVRVCIRQTWAVQCFRASLTSFEIFQEALRDFSRTKRFFLWENLLQKKSQNLSSLWIFAQFSSHQRLSAAFSRLELESYKAEEATIQWMRVQRLIWKQLECSV